MSIEQALLAHTEALHRLCDALSQHAQQSFLPVPTPEAPAAPVPKEVTCTVETWKPVPEEPVKPQVKAKTKAPVAAMVLKEVTEALEAVQPVQKIELPVQEKVKHVAPPVNFIAAPGVTDSPPVVYDDIKAAVQVLLRLEGGQNEVLKTLKDFKVSNARELHVSEWERFLRSIEAVTAKLLQA